MFGFILHLCVVSRLIIFRQFRFISTLVEGYFSRSGFFLPLRWLCFSSLRVLNRLVWFCFVDLTKFATTICVILFDVMTLSDVSSSVSFTQFLWSRNTTKTTKKSLRSDNIRLPRSTPS